MKKIFKIYIVVWVVLLALFNLIAFAAGGFENTDKFTPSFWIGYAFITVAFIAQFICSYVAMKDDSPKKTFLNISLLSTSYIGLFVSFIVGGLCMLIPALPYWVGVIVCAIVFVLHLLAVLKASVAVQAIDRIDEKIQTQTFFIKSLTIDADTLMAMAKSDEAKAECRKIYEAVRYADPMSNAALSGIEGQITMKFAELKAAVEANHTEAVKENANVLLILIKDRNSKCKLLK